jgi:hypothetical protein
LCASFAFAPRDVGASTVVPTSVEEMTHNSDVVAVVTPRSFQSQWNGGRIDTDYDLEVQSVMRGTVQPGSHITLRAAGGNVGRIGQVVPGVPHLAVGQPYIVFLRHDARGISVYYFVHLMAAALPVTDTNGTVTVMPVAEGLRVTNFSAPEVTHVTPTTVMRSSGVRLEELARVVRAVR